MFYFSDEILHHYMETVNFFLTAPPECHFLFHADLNKCVLTYDTGFLLWVRCIPLKFNVTLCLIYRGEERYGGVTYKMTSWWLVLLTRQMALPYTVCVFEHLIYWALPFSDTLLFIPFAFLCIWENFLFTLFLHCIVISGFHFNLILRW